jgi:ribosomal 50S subunit-recycling heat shock protein
MNAETESCRIDVWLWRARFLKTRSQAAAFADDGKVRRASLQPGGAPTRLHKAGTLVRPGDVLVFALGGRPIQARIKALGARRGPPAEAQALYELVEEAEKSPSTLPPAG